MNDKLGAGSFDERTACHEHIAFGSGIGGNFTTVDTEEGTFIVHGIVGIKGAGFTLTAITDIQGTVDGEVIGAEVHAVSVKAEVDCLINDDGVGNSNVIQQNIISTGEIDLGTVSKEIGFKVISVQLNHE